MLRYRNTQKAALTICELAWHVRETMPSRSPRLDAPFRLPRMAAALRRSLALGYSGQTFRADVLAGLVVGIVALPLSMALAVAVGVPPQHGLYTAVVAGALVALLGGSKFQVTGPTAAFIVILEPVTAAHGVSGLLTATVMAGLLLVAMGVTGMGRFIQFIPHPVTTGFTAGIASVIAILQIKDVLGLRAAELPEGTPSKVLAFWEARHSASLSEAAIAGLTLALLLLLPRFASRVTRLVPAPLFALTAAALAGFAMHQFDPTLQVATIGTRFESVIDGVLVRGIPQAPPRFEAPWGADLDWTLIRELLGPACAIAVLGAIESLLSAVVADGLTGTRHDSDAELTALGVGNIVAPFFGGIAATGALARTATNIRSGARSPVAAVVHSLVVLVAILVLAPLVAYVPMAALAALLLIVAWNMAELRHFVSILRIAPRSDVAVLLCCFFLTVVFDMVIAVGVGVVLAALLFMRRMAELTRSRILDADTEETEYALPNGVILYEIAGPLFFGAAQQAVRALDAVGPRTKVVILSLARVPVIDATGIVALESALTRLGKGRTRVVLAGPLPEPRVVFTRADLNARFPHVTTVATLDEGLALARRILDDMPPSAR